VLLGPFLSFVFIADVGEFVAGKYGHPTVTCTMLSAVELWLELALMAYPCLPGKQSHRTGTFDINF
jgi:hypothetical protein